MTNKVDINGFGRIGRRTLSHIAASARNDLEVIEVNTTGPLETSAHLLNYDSIHGRFPSDILIENKTMDLGPQVRQFERYIEVTSIVKSSVFNGVI